jgi:putative spermidine/putrescine transport system ATP-binding protein
MAVEPGVVEQVVYVGMSTRFIVQLDRGERLVAVRQNMDAPDRALHVEGARVKLAWAPDQAYVLDRKGGPEGAAGAKTDT